MDADDRALLDRTAVGDSEAFTVLLHRHFAPTLALVRPRVSSAGVAFDVAAETFAAVVVGAARHTEADVGLWIVALADHKIAESVAQGRVLAVSRRRLLLGAVVLSDADLARIELLCAEAGSEMAPGRLALSDRVVVPGARRWRAQPAAAGPAFEALEVQLCDAVEQAPDVVGLARRSMLRRLRA